MFRPIRRLPRLHPIPAALITAALLNCALFSQVLVTAGPALADSITTASPSAGSRLRSAPGSVQLSFDRLVLPGSGAITVTGPGGQVSQGMTRTIGRSVSRDLGGLADGTYSVSWSVSILLGSNLSGSYRFAVGPKPAPATAKPTTPKASATKTPAPKASASRTARSKASATRSRAAVTAARTTNSAALPVSGGASPAATAAAPLVASVSATGSGHLPSPAVLWGLILLLSVLAVMINRWRRGTGGRERPLLDDARRIQRGVGAARSTGLPAESTATRAAAPATGPAAGSSGSSHTAGTSAGSASRRSSSTGSPSTGLASTGSPSTGSVPGTRASRRTAELPTTEQSGLVRTGTGAVPTSRRGLRQRPAPVEEDLPGLLPRD